MALELGRSRTEARSWSFPARSVRTRGPRDFHFPRAASAVSRKKKTLHCILIFRRSVQASPDKILTGTKRWRRGRGSSEGLSVLALQRFRHLLKMKVK